jgi:hypothetical protein
LKVSHGRPDGVIVGNMQVNQAGIRFVQQRSPYAFEYHRISQFNSGFDGLVLCLDQSLFHCGNAILL